MPRRFNHDEYGFKLVNLFEGDDEAEPHCSLVLKLNNVRKTGEEEYELVGGNPVRGSIELLEDLRESCTAAIRKLRRVQREWQERGKEKGRQRSPR